VAARPIHCIHCNKRQADDGYITIKMYACCQVSDREAFTLNQTPDDVKEERLVAAQLMVSTGEGEEILYRDPQMQGAPVCARRYVSLVAKGGDDDMFSSDFTDSELGVGLLPPPLPPTNPQPTVAYLSERAKTYEQLQQSGELEVGIAFIHLFQFRRIPHPSPPLPPFPHSQEVLRVSGSGETTYSNLNRWDLGVNSRCTPPPPVLTCRHATLMPPMNEPDAQHSMPQGCAGPHKSRTPLDCLPRCRTSCKAWPAPPLC